jgi:hypothetical protein
MQKIAFLFLTLDNPNFPKIWNSYFRGNADKYRIYIHPKYPEKVSWKKNKIIKNLEQTAWGFITRAYIELLKEAFKDPDNYKFVTISESCIPIQSFDAFYKECISDPNSWIKKMNLSKYDIENRIKIAKTTIHTKVPEIFIKNYARFCLNREHVELLLKKTEELNFFHNMHVGDEFFLTVLNPLKNVRNFAVTYDDWDYIKNLIKDVTNKIRQKYEEQEKYHKNLKNKIEILQKEKIRLYKISKNPKLILKVKDDLKKIKECNSFFYRKFAKDSDIEKYWKDIIKAHDKN